MPCPWFRIWSVGRCVLLGLSLALSGASLIAEELRPLALSSRITRVQPQTGIVLWTDSDKNKTDTIQLEFRYVGFNEIVRKAGEYNWQVVDDVLTQVAARGHQTILRFYDTYPGKPTTVPDYFHKDKTYRETKGNSEGKKTSFPDWSHRGYQDFVLEFYTAFAQRYDRDPRLAFVQGGFGLWSEYHIYEGPMELGKTFPDFAYQARFLKHLNATFQETPWMISIDASDDERTPIAGQPELQQLAFGLFDDSFQHKDHAQQNAQWWAFFGTDRWQIAPAGGEFAFYVKKDQSQALAPKGPHGIPFEQNAAQYHISFMIGDDQPRFQKPERIRSAGLACGYKFRVTRFAASDSETEVEIMNTGIAPCYFAAYPTVSGMRASDDLRGLQPGESRTFRFPVGGDSPLLTIESDRLVPGQQIQFAADLKP